MEGRTGVTGTETQLLLPIKIMAEASTTKFKNIAISTRLSLILPTKQQQKHCELS
jgi:hypothetical protein